ncbi:MAG: YraN family protein [Nitrospirota bacterium]
MTKILGDKGEDFAVKFLKEKGYKIIRRNYRSTIGEIDIIAKDGDTIVFIEVKTRTNISFGYPFEAINTKKRQKLKNLALLYLKQQKEEFSVRFDIVSIFCADNGKNKVEHIKDAFEV